DDELGVRRTDGDELHRVSEAVAELQRHPAARHAHVPFGDALALERRRCQPQTLHRIPRRLGVDIAGNVADARQPGGTLSVAWCAAEIAQPRRLLRAMKSPRNSCRPDWKMLSMSPSVSPLRISRASRCGLPTAP